IGLWEVSFGVANLVSSRVEPELSLPSHSKVREADVIVNARVAVDPEKLEQFVRAAVEAACRARKAQAEFRKTQSLRPGRPSPRIGTSTPCENAGWIWCSSLSSLSLLAGSIE